MTAMGPDHDHFHDSVGAYLLRALPEPDELAFERHMATCALCRDEVEDLRAVTDALALAVPAMSPPPALKARVMQVVEQEAELLRAAGPEADRPRPVPAARSDRRRRLSMDWLGRPGFALAAAFVVLAIGGLIGLASGGVFDDDPGRRSVLAEVDQDAAPNARVFLQVDADGGATLVAERLPPPPEGRVYQVWVKRPDVDPEPTRTLFVPRSDGAAAAAVPGSLDGVEAVLVSHEPRGGSPSPTSAPVVTVAPPA
jgi:anti-sigma-K factor RskA